MEEGVDAKFDLCGESFVQFDLHIDLSFLKEASTLVGRSVQVPPTIQTSKPRTESRSTLPGRSEGLSEDQS